MNELDNVSIIPGKSEPCGRRFSVFAIAVAAVVSFIPSGAIAADKVVLQLRWDHQFQFAGYYAAKWQGYYDEAGLDVEIRSAIGPGKEIQINAIEEVAEGRADFAIGAGDILVARDQGAPIVLAASIFQKSPVAVISRPELGIASPTDLVNFTVRARSKDLWNVEFEAMLRAEGIDPATVAVEYNGLSGKTAAELLIDGKINVHLGYFLAALWRAHQLGARLSLLRPSSYGVDFYGDSLFTAEGMIKTNPDLVERFVAASLEGWRYALDNPLEIADRITRELPREIATDDLQGFNRFQAAEIKKLTLYPVVKLGNVNPERWRRMHEAIKGAGIITGNFNTMAFIFDPVRLRQETKNRILLISVIVIVVTLALIVATSAWVIVLRRSVAARTSLLRESEDKLRAVVDNSPANIVLKDTEGRYLIVNKQWERMTGASAEEATGKTAHDFFPPEIAEQIAANDRRILKTLAPLEQDLIYDFPNRAARDVHVQKFPILAADGQPLGIGSILTDITERKRNEDALRESEKRFRAVVDNSPATIVFKDTEDRFVIVNKQWESWFNVKPGDAIGKTVHDFFPRQDADAIAAHDRRVLDGLEAEERVFNITYPDGVVRDVLSQKFPVIGADSQPLGVGSIVTDITERKRTETAFRKQSRFVELLRTIAVAANEASAADQAFQVCLDQVCDYMEWPVGHVYVSDEDGRELVPTELWHLKDPQSHKEFRRVTEETRFAPGIGLPGRVLLSGDPAWIVDVSKDKNFPRAKLAQNIGVKGAFAFPVFVGSDVVAVLEFFSEEAVEPDENLLEVMGHIGIQLGRIIERKRAVENLRESEQRIRGVLDNVVHGIVTIDETGRIESFNAGAEEIFGYPAEEVTGENVRILMPEPDHSRHDGYLDNYLKTGKSAILGVGPREVVGLRKDGEEVPVELGISEMWLKGRRVFIGALVDMTDRKETEQKLLQAQKMEAVGQLTGGVAHDFNNLLTIILGNLQLLERRAGDDARLRKFAEAAAHAAERGADLTSRLLAFSRRQVLEPKVLDLNRLVSGMDDMMRRALGEAVEIETVLAGDLWPAEVDPAQMETSLLNLAVNARDAMGEGGQLTIETANTKVDEAYVSSHSGAKAGDYVMVAVTDTGEGMPQDVVKQAFEPFFTTKETGKGTGLGLSMIYGFVKQSGGYISIYSEEGLGSTVKLLIPRSESLDVTAAKKTSDTGELPKGSETVLVVEDDAGVREVTVAMLEELGYRVLQAESGMNALAVLDEHPDIDLLFSDVVMPGGMSGPVLGKQVLKRRPKIKVLYASGYSHNAFVRNGKLDPDVHLLSKPFRNQDLAREVRRVLDGN